MFMKGFSTVSFALAWAMAAHGQDFPNRPIRIITTLAGGGSDFAARLISQGVSGPLGQPIVIENRPANSTGEIAMRAQPDGYTLVVEGNGFWFAPLIFKMPYDVFRDFSAITLGFRAPNIFVVHPSVAATTIPELIALAKARPGQLNYGSAGVGSTNHLAAEMLNFMTGIKMVHVLIKAAARP
jgi:tripartite-type tricarboxylate transporter receptor subunit TctC